MSQSAFIVRVPEAEPHVAHWRDRFDPSARLGVPAHITLLFPFMSPELISIAVREQLSRLAASIASFTFELASIKRFPGVLYLAPEPAAPFIALTKRLAAQFPEFQPYGGQHEDIVPHLTVARATEPELAHVEAELAASLGGVPLVAECTEFSLIENSTGLWRLAHNFPLAAGTPTDG